MHPPATLLSGTLADLDAKTLFRQVRPPQITSHTIVQTCRKRRRPDGSRGALRLLVVREHANLQAVRSLILSHLWARGRFEIRDHPSITEAETTVIHRGGDSPRSWVGSVKWPPLAHEPVTPNA